MVAVALPWLSITEPDPLLQLFEEDAQILSAGEELELYDELEFYSWLEDTQQG